MSLYIHHSAVELALQVLPDQHCGALCSRRLHARGCRKLHDAFVGRSRIRCRHRGWH